MQSSAHSESAAPCVPTTRPIIRKEGTQRIVRTSCMHEALKCARTDRRSSGASIKTSPLIRLACEHARRNRAKRKLAHMPQPGDTRAQPPVVADEPEASAQSGAQVEACTRCGTLSCKISALTTEGERLRKENQRLAALATQQEQVISQNRALKAKLFYR